jgi:hypothetical protein
MRHAWRVAGILIICSMVGTAFAGEVQLIADQSVPAATGKINFEHDKNHNIKFHIDTKHLARPESLTPPKQAYVVWIQPRGKDPQNAGVLSLPLTRTWKAASVARLRTRPSTCLLQPKTRPARITRVGHKSFMELCRRNRRWVLC